MSRSHPLASTPATHSFLVPTEQLPTAIIRMAMRGIKQHVGNVGVGRGTAEADLFVLCNGLMLCAIKGRHSQLKCPALCASCSCSHDTDDHGRGTNHFEVLGQTPSGGVYSIYGNLR